MGCRQAQFSGMQWGKTKLLPHRALSQRELHLELKEVSSPGCMWPCSRGREPSRKAWHLRPGDGEVYKTHDYERCFRLNAVRKYILSKILVCLNLFTGSLIVGFHPPSSLSKFPLTSPLSPPCPHLQCLASLITHICPSSQLQIFFMPSPLFFQETFVSLLAINQTHDWTGLLLVLAGYLCTFILIIDILSDFLDLLDIWPRVSVKPSEVTFLWYFR